MLWRWLLSLHRLTPLRAWAEKKLTFHTLLRKTLLPFAVLWTTSKTQQVSKWENAGDWTQQSFVAYCKSCISEEKPPGQFLLKRHLQPVEACTSTSPFVTLPFIIFFLARRSFSSHDTTYGFYLAILSTLQTTAEILNNLSSHLQGYS